MQTFRVHVRLQGIRDLGDLIVDSIFSAGFGMISVLEDLCRNRTERRALAFEQLAVYVQERATLEQWQATAKVVEEGDDLVLSFDIPNLNDEFNVVNDRGVRPWLCQFISDHLQHIRCGLVEASFDTDRDVDERERCRRIKHAMHVALNDVSAVPFTFWIEG